MSTAIRSIPSTAAKPSARRRDIQGLRAVAVVAVVLNHAFGWPTGGFVGVDVFFVLSGFLMTSILTREFDRAGTIRFLAFYRRRIRRLVPAATATLLATVGGAYLLFGAGRFASTAWDAVSAFFFAANWRFVAVQTDYFAQDAQTSPIQHFWSLSVEEQFYLVWPLTLLAIGVIFVRRKRPRVWAGVLVFALTAAGFALALQLTAADAGTAYFSTFSRVWELAFGGVVALAMPLLARVGSRIRGTGMAVGLGMIILAYAFTAAGPTFPAPGALLAVLGSGLVIGADFHPARGQKWLPLTTPVAGYLGDISYSLYLWHFPVIIFLGELAKGVAWLARPWTDIVAIVVAVGVAAISHRWIEEPFRTSNWLEPRKAGHSRSGRSTVKRTAIIVTASAIVAATLTAAALGYDKLWADPAGATSARNDPHSGAGPAGSTTEGAGPAVTSTAPGTAQAAMTASLTAALKATSWPTLTPAAGDPKNEQKPPGNIDKCSSAGGFSVAGCTWGAVDAPKTAVLVGDSIAAAYLPALTTIFGEGDWKLVSGAMYACPFVDLTLGTTAAVGKACADRRATEVQTVTSLKPDLVIVANTYERAHIASTGKAATVSEFNVGFDRMLTQIDGAHKQLITIAPLPLDANIADCYTPRTSPADCISKVSASNYETAMLASAATAKKHGGSLMGVTDWFCVDGRCPAFERSVLIKRDTAHPTMAFVLALAPIMREQFAAALAAH